MRKQKEPSILQSIGIMGVNRGNGVTHLAIMLGNYITGKLHKRVAILEMNETYDFQELEDNYGEKGDSEQNLGCFQISKVSYYGHMNHRKIGEIVSRNYDYLILDMGTYEDEFVEDFLKCNIKILIGSLNPWKSKGYLRVIEHLTAYEDIGNMKYLVQSAVQEQMLRIEMVYGITLNPVAYEPDPFLIHGCNFEFLDSVLRLEKS